MVTFETVIADLENKKREQQKERVERLWKEDYTQQKISEEKEQKQQNPSEREEVVIEL